MTISLEIQSDNVIELRDLKDSATGDPVTDATVAVTLLDSRGVEVSGQSWPTTMPHVANALYRGELADNISIAEGVIYQAKVVAEKSGKKKTWWCSVSAVKAGCCA